MAASKIYQKRGGTLVPLQFDFNDLVGTPTTLAGYGVTDAKIANGVITLGANSITPLTQHQDISGKADSADLADYLPLAGGAMTGFITATGDSNSLQLFGGANTQNVGYMGAMLRLYGVDFPDSGNNVYAGQFRIGARERSNSSYADKVLIGYPPSQGGSLTWGGTAVSLDGHTHSQYLTEHQSLSGCVKLGDDNEISTGNWGHRSVGTGFLRLSGGATVNTGANILLYGNSHASNAGRFYIYCNNGTTTKNLNGTVSGTLQWNGQTVSTSSDERLKTAFSQIPADVLDAWGKVNWHRFKFKEDAERKGLENCRWHPGLVAQRVKDVFEADGLDACAYGILCHDEWDDEYDADGSLIRKAGDLWMIRYEEALAMEAAYQRRRADRLEETISMLAARIGAIEDLIDGDLR